MFNKAVRRTTAITIAAVVFGLGTADLASGIDFGANIDSRSDFQADTAEFENTMRAWLRRDPVTGSSVTIGYTLEGMLSHTLTNTEDGMETVLFGDANLAQLQATLPDIPVDRSASEITLGRHQVTEPTGLILSDRLDGATAIIDFPNVGFTVAGGYTGFIDGRTTSIVMTDADQAAVADEEIRPASERAIALGVVEFPELVGRNNISTGGISQWDLRNDDELDEKLNTQYGLFAADGPLGGNLYYTTAVAGSYSQHTTDGGVETGFGLGALAELDAFFGANDTSSLNAMVRYGSGELGEIGGLGELTSFEPISTPPFDVLGPIDREDLLAGTLDYAIRPFAGQEGAAAEWLQLGAYATTSFSSDVAASDAYRGTEGGLRLAARPFSDLGGQVRLSGYSPGEQPGNIDILGRVELSASF